MVSHEDEIFDQNKYFFPEGAAKIRDQRAQPWLEVLAPRDEQGTPGLQPVPDEQKTVYHHDKGLYEDYSALSFRQAPAPETTPLVHTPSLPVIAHTTPSEDNTAQDHGMISSQVQPWSQPESTNYQRDWSRPVPVEQQGQQAQTVVSENYSQPIVEQARQNWLQPIAPSHHAQWSQSITTIEQSTYPEQTYWARPVDQNGSLATYHPSQHSYSSLDVSSRFSGGHASAWSQGTETRPTLTGSPELLLMKETSKFNTKRWSLAALKKDKRRKWWFIGGVFGLLILLGTIIGGVLGSKAARRNSGTSIDTTPGSSNSTVTPLKTIRQNSKLAVTGYRGSNGNYTFRLFYQDPDNRLQFMDKSSIGGIWTDPVTLDTLDYEPMPNGSITAGSYLGNDPQTIELFYLDTTSTIRGQKFNFWGNTIPLKGTASTINENLLKVAGNSSISCYYPYIVSQDRDSGQIHWTRLLDDNATNPTQTWMTNDTGINAVGSGKTDLVLLPIAQTYLDNGGFVYRAEDGKLTVAMKDYTGSATSGASWNHGTLSTVIPADSAIGAFAVGRPYTREDINTYILYQDDNGVIQVIWQEGDDWQGPQTFDALGNAEMGTDIECLTPAAWNSADIDVTREQNMNRCFFQEKGTRRLKEVWFDGNEWRDQGFVPL